LKQKKCVVVSFIFYFRKNAISLFKSKIDYGFFVIDESELDFYEQKCTEHYKFLSWQYRSDGHGGSKGGTLEECL